MLRVRTLAFMLLACLVLLAACRQQPKTTAEVPRVLSPRYSIAVMPFSQPTDACNLIMGHLPENQGCIPADQLVLLDEDLRTLLTSRQHNRNLSFEKTLPPFLATGMNYKASSEPQGLQNWAKLAKKTGKDFILVPQVIDWRERDGGPAGVTHGASIHIELFLIRSETGTIQDREVFKETQQGLTSNLLTVGDFFKRKGTWVTAEELAKEGLSAMLKQMGLLSPYLQEDQAPEGEQKPEK